MKRAELGLQYLHYKKNGFDILTLTHSCQTTFAKPDRQIGLVESRSLQRVGTTARLKNAWAS
ncbi:hypothetical protein [Neorhizobium tomejilense]|uniref:hypothetical protein n=1 Tax=Neorhizobium tomejilense TaxID=2093828 RepID=UPI000CF9F542|nr:hypothetical protein [Neorhizobium tomejilense]